MKKTKHKATCASIVTLETFFVNMQAKLLCALNICIKLHVNKRINQSALMF